MLLIRQKIHLSHAWKEAQGLHPHAAFKRRAHSCTACSCCGFVRHWWILRLSWSIKQSIQTLGREFSFHQNNMLSCFCFCGFCFVPYQQVCATCWRYWHTVLAYLELLILHFSMCPSKGWHMLSLLFQRWYCLLALSAVYQTENATLLLQELHQVVPRQTCCSSALLLAVLNQAVCNRS